MTWNSSGLLLLRDQVFELRQILGRGIQPSPLEKSPTSVG